MVPKEKDAESTFSQHILPKERIMVTKMDPHVPFQAKRKTQHHLREKEPDLSLDHFILSNNIIMGTNSTQYFTV